MMHGQPNIEILRNICTVFLKKRIKLESTVLQSKVLNFDLRTS